MYPLQENEVFAVLWLTRACQMCFGHYKCNTCAVSQLRELREANDSVILNVCHTDASDRKNYIGFVYENQEYSHT